MNELEHYPQQLKCLNETQALALLVGHTVCAGPTEVPMNLSEMTHRIADSLKRMTARLTHRRDTQYQHSSSKRDQEDSVMPDKRSDTD